MDYTQLWERVNNGYYRGKNESEFMNDLFEVYEVQDNPKKDHCYTLAYRFGHSYGYHEILHYFGELVELIK